MKIISYPPFGYSFIVFFKRNMISILFGDTMVPNAE